MANRILNKIARRARRKKSIRKRLFGTKERPRLTVFRSSRHIYAQVVDDFDGKTLASSSTMDKDVREKFAYGGNVEAAKIVGTQVAERAMAKGVESVVLDRNGFNYHGRIRALADAAREKGLKF